MTAISVQTDLLAAVAKWAAGDLDNREHLARVFFRDNEMLACDGHRLVRIPLATHGHSFGIRRVDAIAAVAAQDAVAGCGRRSGRILLIEPRHTPAGAVTIHLHPLAGHSSLVIKMMDVELPRADVLDGIEAAGTVGDYPSAVLFRAGHLAGMAEIASALESSQPYLRVTRWGLAREPLTFEGPSGSRFIVMPVIPDGWGKAP